MTATLPPVPHEAARFDALLDNPILNTDSYKASHWLQYPPGTDAMFSYVESRGGEYDRTVFFGLQMLLRTRLSHPVTHAMVDQARDFFAAHGEPFNEAGWRRLVDRHGGRLPVRIRAVPEGSVVPVGHALMTIECEAPGLFWLASYLETALLRIWYPITVATQSWHMRRVMRRFVEQSCDTLDALSFMLHDFGARGVSSAESAAIGGAAHLVSFRGSDTVQGVLAANLYYDEPMAAWSVPAAEHSTITAWGRDGEHDAFRNMLARFARPGAVVSVVSDSYDLFAALDAWGGPLKQAVIDSGAVLVIRPDSGDPMRIVPYAIDTLARHFGTRCNTRGYKVLNHVKVLQGDGVDAASIERLLAALIADGYAADNVVFGIGGALLQRVHRDTQRFALKCSAIRVDGAWREVYKDPLTDASKRSKRGRLSLLRRDDASAYETVALGDEGLAPRAGWHEALHTVFEDGRLLGTQRFAEVRARAEAADRDIAF